MSSNSNMNHTGNLPSAGTVSSLLQGYLEPPKRSSPGYPERLVLLFILDQDTTQITLSPAYSSQQRKHLHSISIQVGIKSRSIGEEPNRRLVLTKRDKTRDGGLESLIKRSKIFVHYPFLIPVWKTHPLNQTNSSDILPTSSQQKPQTTSNLALPTAKPMATLDLTLCQSASDLLSLSLLQSGHSMPSPLTVADINKPTRRSNLPADCDRLIYTDISDYTKFASQLAELHAEKVQPISDEIHLINNEIFQLERKVELFNYEITRISKEMSTISLFDDEDNSNDDDEQDNVSHSSPLTTTHDNPRYQALQNSVNDLQTQLSSLRQRAQSLEETLAHHRQNSTLQSVEDISQLTRNVFCLPRRCPLDCPKSRSAIAKSSSSTGDSTSSPSCHGRFMHPLTREWQPDSTVLDKDPSLRKHRDTRPSTTQTFDKLGTNTPTAPSILSLPVRGESSRILHALHHNNVVIVVGATGSGKSTQIPQIIYEHMGSCQICQKLHRRNSKTRCEAKIIVTQPRRLAAVSLAQRVASERGEDLSLSHSKAPSRTSKKTAPIKIASLRQQLDESTTASADHLLHGDTLDDEIDSDDPILDQDTTLSSTTPRVDPHLSAHSRQIHKQTQGHRPTVGFTVKGSSQHSADANIVYCTTGILLRKATAGAQPPASRSAASPVEPNQLFRLIPHHFFFNPLNPSHMKAYSSTSLPPGDTTAAFYTSIFSPFVHRLLYCFRNYTHIIVDEVHERDKLTDFLLILLKSVLMVRKDLKVIVMSATVNATLFSQYFGDAPILTVEGRTYPVQSFFLHDSITLAESAYEGSKQYQSIYQLKSNSNDMFDRRSKLAYTDYQKVYQTTLAKIQQLMSSPTGNHDDIFYCHNRRPFTPASISPKHLVDSEHIPPSPYCGISCPCNIAKYTLPVCVNAIMASRKTDSRVQDSMKILEGLLSYIADRTIDPATLDDSLLSIARACGAVESTQEEERRLSSTSTSPQVDASPLQPVTNQISDYKDDFDITGTTVDDDDEITALLMELNIDMGSPEPSESEDNETTHDEPVCPTQAPLSMDLPPSLHLPYGSILIFVSGWSDIQTIAERLEEHPVFGNPDRFHIYPLHSSIQMEQQHLAFEIPPVTFSNGDVYDGKEIIQHYSSPRSRQVKPVDPIWKIVIATNIAETSITIPDVVYVIDLGILKSKIYQPEADLSVYVTSMISRTNAIQRAGRCGRVRPGYCFRLFSEFAYVTRMQEFSQPEMMTTNLEDVVMHAKMLMATGSSNNLSSLSPATQKLMARHYAAFSQATRNRLETYSATQHQLFSVSTVYSSDGARGISSTPIPAPSQSTTQNTGECVKFLSLLPQSPSLKNIIRAIHSLQSVNAFDSNENPTSLASFFNILPLAPRLSRFLLLSILCGCFDHGLTAVSILSSPPLFIRLPPHSVRPSLIEFPTPTNRPISIDARIVRQVLSCGTESDLVAAMHAFYAWLAAGVRFSDRRVWAHQMTISHSACIAVSTNRKHLFSIINSHPILRSLIHQSFDHTVWENVLAGCEQQKPTSQRPHHSILSLDWMSKLQFHTSAAVGRDLIPQEPHYYRGIYNFVQELPSIFTKNFTIPINLVEYKEKYPDIPLILSTHVPECYTPNFQFQAHTDQLSKIAKGRFVPLCQMNQYHLVLFTGLLGSCLSPNLAVRESYNLQSPSSLANRYSLDYSVCPLDTHSSPISCQEFSSGIGPFPNGGERDTTITPISPIFAHSNSNAANITNQQIRKGLKVAVTLSNISTKQWSSSITAPLETQNTLCTTPGSLQTLSLDSFDELHLQEGNNLLTVTPYGRLPLIAYNECVGQIPRLGDSLYVHPMMHMLFSPPNSHAVKHNDRTFHSTPYDVMLQSASYIHCVRFSRMHAKYATHPMPRIAAKKIKDVHTHSEYFTFVPEAKIQKYAHYILNAWNLFQSTGIPKLLPPPPEAPQAKKSGMRGSANEQRIQHQVQEFKDSFYNSMCYVDDPNKVYAIHLAIVHNALHLVEQLKDCLTRFSDMVGHVPREKDPSAPTQLIYFAGRPICNFLLPCLVIDYLPTSLKIRISLNVDLVNSPDLASDSHIGIQHILKVMPSSANLSAVMVDIGPSYHDAFFESTSIRTICDHLINQAPLSNHYQRCYSIDRHINLMVSTKDYFSISMLRLYILLHVQRVMIACANSTNDQSLTLPITSFDLHSLILFSSRFGLASHMDTLTNSYYVDITARDLDIIPNTIPLSKSKRKARGNSTDSDLDLYLLKDEFRAERFPASLYTHYQWQLEMLSNGIVSRSLVWSHLDHIFRG